MVESRYEILIEREEKLLWSLIELDQDGQIDGGISSGNTNGVVANLEYS